MNASVKSIMLLALLSLSACAPVIYDGEYRDHRSHSHYARTQIATDYRYSTRHLYPPIELTIYAEQTYYELSLSPLYYLFYDGDFIEVPIRGRHGHNMHAFAHYSQGELHFDRDRECRRINKAPGFKYDKKWEKGHRYDNAFAGVNKELANINIKIRKASLVDERTRANDTTNTNQQPHRVKRKSDDVGRPMQRIHQKSKHITNDVDARRNDRYKKSTIMPGERENKIASRKPSNKIKIRSLEKVTPDKSKAGSKTDAENKQTAETKDKFKKSANKKARGKEAKYTKKDSDDEQTLVSEQNNDDSAKIIKITRAAGSRTNK